MNAVRASRRERGAALVEFVLVAGLLFLLIFGIVEMGLIFRDQAALGNAAREGARSLALGSPVATVTTRIINAAAGGGVALDSTNSTITLQYSTDGGTTYSASSDVTDPYGSVWNNSVSGNLVRATITYNHSLITGMIFTGGTKQLSARVVMRRE